MMWLLAAVTAINRNPQGGIIMESNPQQPGDKSPGDHRSGEPQKGGPQSGEQEQSHLTIHDPATRPAARVKKTIMDLARYRLGQRVYWIVFRGHRDPNCECPEERMRDEHPWLLWRRKMMPWTVPMKPPRTHPADTMAVMMLCGQRPRIEPFRITDITRSANSGEFLYTGPGGMVMPEGLLFPTKKAARREIARIAKVFAAWTGTWQDFPERQTGSE